MTLRDSSNDGQKSDEDSDSEVTVDVITFQILNFWQMRNML